MFWSNEERVEKSVMPSHRNWNSNQSTETYAALSSGSAMGNTESKLRFGNSCEQKILGSRKLLEDNCAKNPRDAMVRKFLIYANICKNF